MRAEVSVSCKLDFAERDPVWRFFPEVPRKGDHIFLEDGSRHQVLQVQWHEKRQGLHNDLAMCPTLIVGTV